VANETDRPCTLQSVTGFTERSITRLERRQPTLWLLAVVCFGIGDLVTTAIGVQTSGVVEAGPVVGPIIAQYGVGGMASFKLLTIGVGFGIWGAMPAPHRVGVPLGLAVVGVTVTGWNAMILSTALLG